MTEPEKTLSGIRKSPKLATSSFRASDFLSKEEVDKLHTANLVGRKEKAKFDEIDAYCAEIIARFGYEAYKDWNRGVIEPRKMSAMIYAERARDKQKLIGLESLLYGLVSSCVRVHKGEPKPKGLKLARSVIKSELKVSKGVF